MDINHVIHTHARYINDMNVLGSAVRKPVNLPAPANQLRILISVERCERPWVVFFKGEEIIQTSMRANRNIYREIKEKNQECL